jgi:hypothetical protein
MTDIDAARTTTASSEGDDLTNGIDARKVSALVWIIPTLAFWLWVFW